MHKSALVAATVLALTAPAFAASSRGAANATVGGHQVAIDYGRPSLKGRSFDELAKQLPADRMWRAGSEQVTTLKCAGAIVVGGKPLPAGTYSLYVHAPAAGEHSLVLNKDLGIALGKIWAKAPDNMKNEPWPHVDDYTAAIGNQEVVRVPLKQGTPKAPADLFTITLDPTKAGATLTLSWGDRSWSLDITAAK